MNDQQAAYKTLSLVFSNVRNDNSALEIMRLAQSMKNETVASFIDAVRSETGQELTESIDSQGRSDHPWCVKEMVEYFIRQLPRETMSNEEQAFYAVLRLIVNSRAAEQKALVTQEFVSSYANETLVFLEENLVNWGGITKGRLKDLVVKLFKNEYENI